MPASVITGMPLTNTEMNSRKSDINFNHYDEDDEKHKDLITEKKQYPRQKSQIILEREIIAAEKADELKMHQITNQRPPRDDDYEYRNLAPLGLPAQITQLDSRSIYIVNRLNDWRDNSLRSKIKTEKLLAISENIAACTEHFNKVTAKPPLKAALQLAQWINLQN